jgi:hypothetical protein
MEALINRHLNRIRELFDSEFTVNQFDNEVEVTNVVYFESWDVDDLLEPLHVVAVYHKVAGYVALKTVFFPFVDAEEWMSAQLLRLYDKFYDTFFMHEEALA